MFSSRILHDALGFVLHTSRCVPYVPWKDTQTKHHQDVNHLVLCETHLPFTRKQSNGAPLDWAHRYVPLRVVVVSQLVLGWLADLFFGAASGRTEVDDHSRPLTRWSSPGFASESVVENSPIHPDFPK